MTSNEATLCDAQPAAAEDDAVVVVADVREEPQCEITVVECDRPHNTAHGVQQQRPSDDLQVQPVKRLSNFFVHRCFLFSDICSGASSTHQSSFKVGCFQKWRGRQMIIHINLLLQDGLLVYKIWFHPSLNPVYSYGVGGIHRVRGRRVRRSTT